MAAVGGAAPGPTLVVTTASVQHNFTQGFIETFRTVEESNFFAKLCVWAVAFFAALALVLSLVGTVLLVKCVQEYSTQQTEADSKKSMAAGIAALEQQLRTAVADRNALQLQVAQAIIPAIAPGINIQDLERRLDALRDEAADLRTKKEAAERSIAQLIQVVEAEQPLKVELVEGGRYKTLRLGQTLQAEEAAGKAETEINGLRQALTAKTQEFQEASHRVEELTQTIQRVEREHAAAVATKDSAREEVARAAQDAERRVSELNRELAALRQKLAAAEDAGRATGQTLAQTSAELERLQEEHNKVKTENETQKARIDQLSASLQASDSQDKRRIEELSGQLAEAGTQLQQSQARAKELDAQIDQLRNDQAAALQAKDDERDHIATEHAEEAERLNAQIEQLTAELQEANRVKKETAGAAESFSLQLHDLNQEKAALESSSRSLATQLETLRKEATAAAAERDTLQAAKEALAKDLETANTEKAQAIATLERLRADLQEIENQDLPGKNEALNNDLIAARSEAERLKIQINGLEEEVEAARTSSSTQLQESNGRLDEATRAVTSLGEELTQKDAQIQELDASNQTLTTKLSQSQALVATMQTRNKEQLATYLAFQKDLEEATAYNATLDKHVADLTKQNAELLATNQRLAETAKQIEQLNQEKEAALAELGEARGALGQSGSLAAGITAQKEQLAQALAASAAAVAERASISSMNTALEEQLAAANARVKKLTSELEEAIERAKKAEQEAQKAVPAAVAAVKQENEALIKKIQENSLIFHQLQQARQKAEDTLKAQEREHAATKTQLAGALSVATKKTSEYDALRKELDEANQQKLAFQRSSDRATRKLTKYQEIGLEDAQAALTALKRLSKDTMSVKPLPQPKAGAGGGAGGSSTIDKTP